jgi:dTDP-4-amino-4,6-dideoxygalactose transaminase
MNDKLGPEARNKSDLKDLAIFGGVPAFQAALHVGRPNIGNRERLFKTIEEILDRKWLTNDGPCVKEFEQRICELLGVTHCIAVCNATAGLEILAKALGLSGEVILPSFTFVATAHALQWLGIKPVFCDIDPATHNLDPRRVSELINQRTSAILGVHVWGRPCDIPALVDLARAHKLKLLFDAAHAFGCSYQGRFIGGFGDAELFSFHATKFINTFEGGAVVTNDTELATRLRLMRNFGFAGLDNVASLGINAKMNEASAAMGLTSLLSMDEFVGINRLNYEAYQRQLSELPDTSLLRYDESERCNYQYVVIEIDEAQTGLSRNLLDEILWAENVLTRRYFYPGCHRMEPYRRTDPDAALRLGETETLAQRVLCLPTGSAIGSAEVGTICELVRFILGSGPAIKERMSVKPLYRHPLRRSC